MKKYDMSVIDSSELTNITTNIEKLNKAKEKMKECGIIDENEKVAIPEVKKLAEEMCFPLFERLERRCRRYPGRMKEIYENVNSFAEHRENIALYFYIAYLYGFLQWSVPVTVELLPADKRVLAAFVKEFKLCFSGYMDNSLNNGTEKIKGEE